VGSDQERLGARPAAGLRVAYLMSRFPKVTETFVLSEMVALEELGARVEVYPLLREHETVVHDEARDFAARAHYTPFLSPAILGANLACLVRRPWRYLSTLGAALLHTLPSANFFGGALLFLPKAALFARTMEREGIQHLHAHFANHPALVARVVHGLTGIPYSFTAHGSDLHVDQTALAWKLAAADFGVTVSEYNREFVRERAGAAAAEKLLVIHCGVDARTHVRTGEPPSPPFEILCVAALREVKGHAFLLDACRLLRDQGLALRCHLVGGGELERRLRARVQELGLEREVVFHGPQARAGVLERMRAAHALVLASIQDKDGRREGIPVTLMEAMSCALPVVASRISGIPELVEHDRSGLLFPPGDAAALAAALARLAAEPALRARLGAAGRERVRRDFDLADGARRLAQEILRRRIR